MTRFSDDQCHGDPHKPAPLGRTAITAVAVYVLAGVVGWCLVGVLAAWVLL